MNSIKPKGLIDQSRPNLKLITLLTICSFLLAFSLPAMAKHWHKSPSISAVVVDIEAGEMQIFGHYFDNPKVTLGALELLPPHMLSESGELIVAIPPLDPGDYKLILEQGKHGKENTSYDLTVGAVGPPGPAGPAGGVGARTVLTSTLYLADPRDPQVLSAFCSAAFPRIVFCGYEKGDLDFGEPEFDGVEPVLGDPDSCEYNVYGGDGDTLVAHLLCSE